MRKILCFLIGNAVASASVLDAVAHVESGGKHSAIGDSGKALGAWQMHRAAWQDAAARLRVSWPFSDAHNLSKSRRIAAEHLRWLNEQFTRRTGRKPTPADSYALWNLGVAGYARRNWDITRCPEITQRAVRKLNTYLR